MKNRDGAGSYPDASWTTDYHTGAEVNVYASGYRAEDFAGITDNTEIHDVLASFSIAIVRKKTSTDKKNPKFLKQQSR